MYPGTHAQRWPDRPAVVMAGSGQVLSYGELERDSARLAHYLAAAGLRRGDNVAVITDNRPEAFVVYWGALRSGLYITFVNHQLGPDEAGYIVADAGARALIVSSGKAELGAAVASGLPPGALRLSFGGPVAGFEALEAALATAPSAPPLDQPCGSMMLYSSGTTGRPKGVRPPLPDRQVGESGDPLVALNHEVYGIDADTVYLSPAPIYHSAPVKWCHSVHAHGGTVVMMERFDAEGVLRAIDRHRVTHAQFVPTMLVRILRLDPRVRARYDTGSLRVAVHAAAPCPSEVKEALIAEWGPIVWEYYGQTETLGITIIDSAQALAKPGSVGRPVLGIVRVCDEHGREVPPGQIGTVYFERERFPFAYHNDPERTRAAQHPRHPTWGTVGDVGYLDPEGYLFLTDRQAFMIISGGVNIYPQEVENCLTLHPAVHDVAVLGLPDAEMGEAVAAFVQLEPGADAADPAGLQRDLIDFVRGRIAHYKAPRTVAFVDTLPRTPTGKLVKGRLRELVLGAEAGPPRAT